MGCLFFSCSGSSEGKRAVTIELSFCMRCRMAHDPESLAEAQMQWRGGVCVCVQAVVLETVYVCVCVRVVMGTVCVCLSEDGDCVCVCGMDEVGRVRGRGDDGGVGGGDRT